MSKYPLLALALVCAAASAQAQPVVDSQGRPVISSPPQPGPGDYSGTSGRPGLQPADDQAQAVSPYRGTVRHEEAFRDEYGFRYDARGNRIDSTGHRISPHTTTP